MTDRTNQLKLAGLLCVTFLLMVIGGKPVMASFDEAKVFAAEPPAMFFGKKNVPGIDVVVKKSPGNSSANNRKSGPDGTATFPGFEVGSYVISIKLPASPVEKGPQPIPQGSRGSAKISASAQGETLSFRGVAYQISISGVPLDASKASLYQLGTAPPGAKSLGGYEFEYSFDVKSLPSRGLTVKIVYDFPEAGQPAGTKNNSN